jgi:hypothetical protein
MRVNIRPLHSIVGDLVYFRHADPLIAIRLTKYLQGGDIKGRYGFLSDNTSW